MSLSFGNFGILRYVFYISELKNKEIYWWNLCFIRFSWKNSLVQKEERISTQLKEFVKTNHFTNLIMWSKRGNKYDDDNILNTFKMIIYHLLLTDILNLLMLWETWMIHLACVFSTQCFQSQRYYLLNWLNFAEDSLLSLCCMSLKRNL